MQNYEQESMASAIDLFTGTPVATILQKIYQFYSSVKLESMRIRFEKFLTHSLSVSDKERVQFLDSLGEEKQQFTREVFLTLERLDKEDKAEILGKLTGALFLKFLQPKDYLRLCGIVERTFYSDLVFLYRQHSDPARYEGKSYVPIIRTTDSEFISNNLITQGLFKQTKVALLNELNSEPLDGFTPTIYGELLLQHGF